jgi:nucleoside-diphosphate-sugar epimerase
MFKNEKVHVLLIGASGMLGGSILDACLEAGHKMRVLLRAGKPELEESLKEKGVEILHGDVLQPETLPKAMEGIDVVVSTLHNDPGLFVPGHKNLIEAAELAGVKRMVPSDFSVDFTKLDKDENFNLAMRLEVFSLFEGKKVRPMHVLIGAFMDTVLDTYAPFIDWETLCVPYYGDGQQTCDFTSVRDAGKVVAAVVADYQEAPEKICFAGDVLTMPQLAESVGAGTGKSLTSKRIGSVDELPPLIKQKQETATNPWEWLALQYQHNMFSGRAKMDPLDNDRYSSVKPESVKEFAERTKDIKINGLGNSNK